MIEPCDFLEVKCYTEEERNRAVVRWTCPRKWCGFQRDFYGDSAEAKAHRLAVQLRLRGCPHGCWFPEERDSDLFWAD